ncbi:DoxX family protein [Aquirhabdus parva]|uniref:DoxX family protein n=1 Tax=Aquirhabdus parva TaxID=2283318 RepID=A0A345P2V4_9GAMM|nr:DoxX family protein [Aquirhabdus parva]AXI01613.1 DoxX family protein [Aquirhabdus parva]
MSTFIKNSVSTLDALLDRLGQIIQPVDGLPALALRLYLVPVFWTAGMNKLAAFSDTIAWFGADGLGLPFPTIMASLATGTELSGAVLLALGLFTRWISIPLIVTMLVAIFTVHLPNGWQAIADQTAPFANMRVMEAGDKIQAAREILKEHGDYDWLTSSGNFAIINNGVEFAVTYLVMLLALIKMGGGRFVSVDYWVRRVVKRWVR